MHVIEPAGFDLSDRALKRAGVPDTVHEAADARLTIPMAEGARSINLALSVAMVAGEAMRQIGWG